MRARGSAARVCWLEVGWLARPTPSHHRRLVAAGDSASTTPTCAIFLADSRVPSVPISSLLLNCSESMPSRSPLPAASSLAAPSDTASVSEPLHTATCSTEPEGSTCACSARLWMAWPTTLRPVLRSLRVWQQREGGDERRAVGSNSVAAAAGWASCCPRPHSYPCTTHTHDSLERGQHQEGAHGLPARVSLGCAGVVEHPRGRQQVAGLVDLQSGGTGTA
jgi:hypothetical protein